MTHRSLAAVRVACLLTAVGLGLLVGAAASADGQAAPIKLLFLYGSEKQKWLEEVNKKYHGMVNGRPVVVEAAPMGSGDIIDAVLNKKLQPTLICPASKAYLKLGDDQAANMNPPQPPLLAANPESLFRSPVVIAMWRPMAEALGWPAKPIGWKDLHALAVNKDGWKSVGYPQWGAFKFGHTHPEESNSGLAALLSEAYAAARKKTSLTEGDVEAPDTTKFLTELEHSVVHYGESTGFFGETMFNNGPDYLSGAVLYENQVIDSYPTGDSEKDKNKPVLTYPVVAIYPEEGTFWTDHPVGVVQRDWVKDDQKAAAEDYIRFLLDKEQQEAALARGFRPANPAVPIGPPIDKAHGVDPSKPDAGDVLDLPDAKVMEECLLKWKDTKKKAHVVLLIDASQSMNFGPSGACLFNAQDGAVEAIGALAKGDTLSVMLFNDSTSLLVGPVELTGAPGQIQQLQDKVKNGIVCKNSRHLYDAIADAHDYLMKQDAGQDVISAVVVLTKATPDAASTLTLAKLQRLLDRDGIGDKSVHIFTFAYESAEQEKKAEKGEKDEGAEPLKAIAGASRGEVKFGNLKSDEADTHTVRKLIKAFAFLF